MSSVRRSILTLVLGFGAAGCQAAPSSTPARPSPPAPAAAPESVVLPDCAIGSMPSAGRKCTPVGPGDVPKGFQRALKDWGFHAILPWGECAPGTRSVLGTARCIVVDPCDAPFPPAGATVVHDATELKTALAAAAEGATIALDEGSYGAVVLDRGVNLVGRCAEKVVFQGAGNEDKGIGVDGAHTISIRSVTVKGFGYGVWAGGGASVSVAQSIFAENGAAAWIVREAKLDLQGSLVFASSDLADGVLVGRGGHAQVTGSELRNMHIALQAFGDGSTATGSELVISDRSAAAADELAALVVASKGGRVDLDRSLVFATNIFAGGAAATDPRETGSSPATLHVANSEVLRLAPTNAGGFDVTGSTLELVGVTFGSRGRVAISATGSANVALDHTVIRPVLATDVANRGVGAGVVLNDDSRLTMSDSAIMGMAQSAVLSAKGCHARLDRSFVARTWEFERTDLDKRMHSGQAISLSGDAALEMSDSTLLDNAGAAIWTDRANASIALERSAIVDTRAPEQSNAVAGVIAWAGTLDVSDSLVHGMPGTALALGNVTGAISKSVLSKTDVAFRWLGDTRSVATTDDARRPQPGEILTRGDVLVDTNAAEATDALPLGDCRCTTATK